MSLTKRIIFFLSIIALSLVGCCLPSGDLLVIDSEGMFTLRPLRAAPGTLTGQVFLDADYNGQRDVGGAGGDTPWPNVPVTLWTKVGAATSTTTDANGVYSFSADPGRYEIGVTGQGNYLFSPQDVGDDATDSDVGPTGRSATVVLTSTQVITIDAGMGIPPTPTPTPTPPQSPLPTPPPFSPLPTPTPTPEGYTLPTDRSLLDQCFFTPPPGGIPNEPIIPLSAYSFSAPQEVITHTAPIGIEQWLPDNETLLITRESMENQLVSVDLVNTTTGVVTQIVEPLQYLMEPRWLSLNDTVAWRAIGTLDDMDPGVWEPGYWVRSLDPPGSDSLPTVAVVPVHPTTCRRMGSNWSLCRCRQERSP